MFRRGQEVTCRRASAVEAAAKGTVRQRLKVVSGLEEHGQGHRAFAHEPRRWPPGPLGEPPAGINPVNLAASFSPNLPPASPPVDRLPGKLRRILRYQQLPSKALHGLPTLCRNQKMQAKHRRDSRYLRYAVLGAPRSCTWRNTDRGIFLWHSIVASYWVGPWSTKRKDREARRAESSHGSRPRSVLPCISCSATANGDCR